MRVRVWLGVVALVLGVIGISWQQAPRAAACSCVVSTPAELAGRADLVAVGDVVAVDKPSSPSLSMDDAVYTVALRDLWKGEAPPTVEVHSAVSGASCGLEGIEEGTTIVLFARFGTDELSPASGDLWRSGLCDGTGPVDDSFTAAISDALGEPTAVEQGEGQTPAPDPGAGGSPAPDMNGALLLIAAVAVLAAVVSWFSQARR